MSAFEFFDVPHETVFIFGVVDADRRNTGNDAVLDLDADHREFVALDRIGHGLGEVCDVGRPKRARITGGLGESDQIGVR